MSEPIQTPEDLVDAFKKSGEFDRMRRELLAEFRKSDGVANFRARVEDIAQTHLRRQKERRRPTDGDTDALQRNLMAEMDRFPVVDRAITEMRVFRDDSTVKMNVNNSLMRVLLKSRGEPIPPELEELHDDGGDLSPRKARSPSRDFRGGETPDLRRDESEVRDHTRAEPTTSHQESRGPSPVADASEIAPQSQPDDEPSTAQGEDQAESAAQPAMPQDRQDTETQISIAPSDEPPATQSVDSPANAPLPSNGTDAPLVNGDASHTSPEPSPAPVESTT
ncbi:hypothetical protein EV714DRAFT_270421 [Schizophyllum commune]